jgi:hypothetical protein
MLRDALKQPLKEAAKAREIVYFKNIAYKDGKPTSQGATAIQNLPRGQRPMCAH